MGRGWNRLFFDRRGKERSVKEVISDSLDMYIGYQIFTSLTNGTFIRASKDCICETCKLSYDKHPKCKDYPTFRLLCDDTVVKL